VDRNGFGGAAEEGGKLESYYSIFLIRRGEDSDILSINLEEKEASGALFLDGQHRHTLLSRDGGTS